MDYLCEILYTSGELLSRNIITTITATTACILTLCIYYDSKNKHNYWKNRGIKGPEPIPVFGNLISLVTGNRLKKELEWVQKYGKVYGIYQGTKPHLIVADAEVILQICIKDFDAFPNHIHQEFVSKYFLSALFTQNDNYWKSMRALMSPTFTSSKIRRMFRFLDECADDLIQCFQDQLTKTALAIGSNSYGAVVDIKDLYSNYTMDAIATCCYGLKLERAGSKNVKASAKRDEFVKNASKIFKFSIARLLIAFALPKPLLRLVGFQVNTDKNFEPLTNKLRQLIDQRRQLTKTAGARQFDDYLQLLIDAKLDDKMEPDEMDEVENHYVAETTTTATREASIEDRETNLNDTKFDTTTVSGKMKLSDFEILSNAATLMVVGLETTSVLLMHCTYALAFHPDVQDRLYEEIMRIAEFDEVKKKYRFNYESLTSYRNSGQDYYLKKYQLSLPKDSKIQLAYYAIQNDPDYWPEPQRFNPERFMPGKREKIVPGSYCPFGVGPRHCLGMRFSLTESKLGLAKIIANYRFHPAPNTKFPPEPKQSFGQNNIETPYIIVTNRSK